MPDGLAESAAVAGRRKPRPNAGQNFRPLPAKLQRRDVAEFRRQRVVVVQPGEEPVVEDIQTLPQENLEGWIAQVLPERNMFLFIEETYYSKTMFLDSNRVYY